jgi:hypothetical protein
MPKAYIMPVDEEPPMRTATPYSNGWSVDCPYCEKAIEDVDEGEFGQEYECDFCQETFYIESE